MQFVVNFIHERSKCAHFTLIMKIICDVSYRKRVEQLAATLIPSICAATNCVNVFRYMGSVYLTGRNSLRINAEELPHSTCYQVYIILLN
jgi:hypothetical protein